MLKNNLRFLIIGLGSMGKRRIRNLKVHKQEQVIGFDFSEARRKEVEKEYGITTIADLKKLDPKSYDAIIISTPPNQHGEYIRFALKQKKHFFTEVTTSDDGYKEAIRDKSKIVKAPSHTFRYFLPIKMVKDVMDSGKIGTPLAFQYHMGQYLPDWHPWEDYRKVYFSKKDTGACREMLPFELIWLTWLLQSPVQEVSGYITKVSDLDMPADDIIAANLKFKNGVLGNLIIDVIARKPFRTLKVLGTEGVLEWQWLQALIKVHKAGVADPELIEVPKGNPHKGYLAAEEMYIDEIGAFLDAIHGKRPFPYSFKEDLQNLKALYSLEKASKTKKYQKI